MANEDIRIHALKRNVKMFEIAKNYGVNDGNFSRKMRFELPEDEKTKIKSIIDAIADSRR